MTLKRTQGCKASLWIGYWGNSATGILSISMSKEREKSKVTGTVDKAAALTRYPGWRTDVQIFVVWTIICPRSDMITE